MIDRLVGPAILLFRLVQLARLERRREAAMTSVEVRDDHVRVVEQATVTPTFTSAGFATTVMAIAIRRRASARSTRPSFPTSSRS